ncbi:MAG: hypothetical protein ACRD2N_20100 [Vicinamibacterales bacterium]
MAAIFAAERGADTLLLERTADAAARSSSAAAAGATSSHRCSRLSGL